MNTTSLFVELLVIGVGGVLWLIVGLAALFDLSSMAPVLQQMHSNAVLFLLGPLTALTYVVGIILDRLADAFFGLEAGRLAKQDRERRGENLEAKPLQAVEDAATGQVGQAKDEADKQADWGQAFGNSSHR